MTKVNVVDRDITRVKADALITVINSGGLWLGGIDGAIQRVSGDMFHNQASAKMPLCDGQVLFAPATRFHSGRFDSVIFVIDDLKQPVSNLLIAALDEAEARSLTTVSLPTLRTGVMAGVHETRREALVGLTQAIKDFVIANPQSSVKEINVVVYSNYRDVTFLKTAL